MSAVTFEEITIVRVDGKIVGDIRLTPGGYQYRVKGKSKYVGSYFPTLDRCKQSLVDMK